MACTLNIELGTRNLSDHRPAAPFSLDDTQRHPVQLPQDIGFQHSAGGAGVEHSAFFQNQRLAKQRQDFLDMVGYIDQRRNIFLLSDCLQVARKFSLAPGSIPAQGSSSTMR